MCGGRDPRFCMRYRSDACRGNVHFCGEIVEEGKFGLDNRGLSQKCAHSENSACLFQCELACSRFTWNFTFFLVPRSLYSLLCLFSTTKRTYTISFGSDSLTKILAWFSFLLIQILFSDHRMLKTATSHTTRSATKCIVHKEAIDKSWQFLMATRRTLFVCILTSFP